MDSVRADKWLWAARFFKTRALASKACDLGRIDWRKGEIAWQPVKASRDVHAGEMLKIRNAGGEFVIEVLALSEVRGSASVAQTLYRETDESKAARAAVVEAKKAIPIYESTWEAGRPTKRDRRVIDKFRGR
ncbi:MAG: RNA-binding S4 domain-containing protein [Edaphobacter sp.]|uniref:RNA-binding S4 domain-containing protein n=1 Tax=Edaphobacter sp. TaxID=1934404 RepID=UPI0023A17B5D|nr:RNA-binding S4 domain-containing protein [Edaphobacter sp.]MDE1176330.1 RNA-binding S4 domain-containing protein [Edaphobacter sp.]